MAASERGANLHTFRVSSRCHCRSSQRCIRRGAINSRSHGPAIRIRLLSRRESVSHEPSSIPQQAWSALLAARPRPCPAGGHITLLLLGRWAHARQIHLAGCRLVPSESCSCSQRFARHSVGRRTSEGCRRRRPLPPRHREPPATACDQGWRRSSPAKAVARRAAARRRAGSAGRRAWSAALLFSILATNLRVVLTRETAGHARVQKKS